MNKQQTIRAILDAAAEGNLSKAEDALDDILELVCAEKDREIAELTREVGKIEDTCSQLLKRGATKEEAIKELVKGLMCAYDLSIDVMPAEYKTNDRVKEKWEHFEQLIQKHKV